jgi:hypothetical protein
MKTYGLLEFTPCSPRLWKGRYRITNAEENVFHIRFNSELREWWPFIVYGEDDYAAQCPAVDSGAVRYLVTHINSMKYAYQYSNGGAFLINEFGQVIVPVSTTERILVGEIKGKMLFQDSLNGGILDLSEAGALNPGDTWKGPYLGMVYNYNPSKGVLYKDEKGAPAEYPLSQDYALNNNLNYIRPSEYWRFIVNPCGVVLTK